MAIRIIEGKIGSGKTYYAVNHVFRNWYRWCDETDSWVLKKNDVEVKVYSNIDDMKIGYDLYEAIEEAGGLNPFFTKPYQLKFSEGCNVVYIIDEAQAYDFFHRSYKDEEVFTFFQRSRKYGIDIYLITQDVQCLARQLRALAEYHIVAVPRTKSIGNMLTFKFYSGKDCYKTKRIKKDQKVFGLYSSMLGKETEKIQSAVLKYIIMFVLILGSAGLMFKFVFLDRILGMATKTPSAPVVELEKVEQVVQRAFSNNSYKIIGIVDNQYILKTNNGLKRVEIDKNNVKRINDEIIIENM